MAHGKSWQMERARWVAFAYGEPRHPLTPDYPRGAPRRAGTAISFGWRRKYERICCQRCQAHKARNIIERLPKHFHASVRRTLRRAWEMDDADKAEKLIRDLAQRLEREAPGVSAGILEGLNEILAVNRLGLPAELRCSLACANIVENMNGTIRRVCRNARYWQDASMALRWTGAGMREAAKGFRRLKAYRRLPLPREALAAHQAKYAVKPALDRHPVAA